MVRPSHRFIVVPGEREAFEATERERVLSALRASLDQRIRPICAHWPEEDIAILIARMASFRYKYEGAGALQWSASTGRPIDMKNG